MKIAKKIEDRITASIPKFQAILKRASALDLNESDTVTIIGDMLAEMFGYDKYSEVTSELAIRGTYCDLAIKIKDKWEYLIECKAVGCELKEAHMRQAINYGANKGIQWVILTNGIEWQLYRLRFEQPISWDLVLKLNMNEGSPKDQRFIDSIYLLCKEGIDKSAREDLHEKIQCVNRFMIGTILMSPPVVSIVRRELRQLADGVTVLDEEVLKIIKDGCLRRDLIDGEEAEAARKKYAKTQTREKRPPAKKTDTPSDAPAPTAPSAPQEPSTTDSQPVDPVSEN